MGLSGFYFGFRFFNSVHFELLCKANAVQKHFEQNKRRVLVLDAYWYCGGGGCLRSFKLYKKIGTFYIKILKTFPLSQSTMQ